MPSAEIEQQRASLVDILDRTLRTGVAVRGDIMISVAGVDLVGLDLRIVLAAAGRLRPPPERSHDNVATGASSNG